MDNNQLQYIKIQSQYADKVEQFEKCVVKAAKLTHAIADTAEKKCKQARMAMESGNIECHAEYDSAVHLPVRTGLVAFPGCSDTACRWEHLCTALCR